MQDILEGKKNGVPVSIDGLKTKEQKVENKSPNKVNTTPSPKQKAKKADVKKKEEEHDDDEDDDDEEESEDDDDDDEEDDEDDRKSKKKSMKYDEYDGPSRKSSRTRAKVSYKDEAGEDDDDEE